MAFSTDSQRRAAAIFDELAVLPAAEQRQALERLRSEDPVIEQAVRGLMASRVVTVAPGRTLAGYRVLHAAGGPGTNRYFAERADGLYSPRAIVQLVPLAQPLHAAARVQFLAECQTIATLRHPNFANMLEAGFSESGEAFVVSEYVDGLSIDLHADRNQLTIPQRLDLFLDLCAAVEFLHARLLVHGCLEASSAVVDTEGRLKLTDVGLVRLLRGANEPLTTAMDVRALRAILLELLTGNAPASKEIAAARSTSVRGLRKTLAGDLNAILDKDDYASAAELAADILRYRRDEPVLARPQTSGYRLRKWIKRNPVQTAAAGLAIFGLLTGIALREQQRWVASARFDELRSLAHYQMFDLQEQMASREVPVEVRKAMAMRSLAALDRLAEERAPDFELQADLTQGYLQLAELFGNPYARPHLGEPELSRKLLAKARQWNDILQTMQGPARVKQALQAQFDLQDAMFDPGPLRAAKVEPAMRSLEEVSDAGAMNAAGMARMSWLSRILHAQANVPGRLAKARYWIDLAIAKDPRNPALALAGLEVATQEAIALSATDAPKAHEQLLALLTRFDDKIGSGERVHAAEATLFGAIGSLENRMQLYEPAGEHLIAARDLWQKWNYRQEWARTLRELGLVYEAEGKHAETIETMQSAIRELEKIGGAERQVAELQVRIARHLGLADRIEDARNSLRHGQDGLLTLARRPDAPVDLYLQTARALLDVPLADARRASESLEMARKAATQMPKDAAAAELLAQSYAWNGMREQAVEALKTLKTIATPEAYAEAEKKVESTLAAAGK